MRDNCRSKKRENLDKLGFRPNGGVRNVIQNPDNCSKCGLCLNACPVYRELLIETVSPRGKIQLSKRILDGRLELSREMQAILSRCLLCGSCSAACPCGVQGAQLFSGMRWLAYRRLGLDWRKKTLYRILAEKWLLSSSAKFAAWAHKHFGNIAGRKFVGEFPLIDSCSFNKRPFTQTATQSKPSSKLQNARVLYFHGCATNYLDAQIGNAVLRVLAFMGIEVQSPADQGCCGIPIIISGSRELALKSIRSVINTFARPDVEAVVVDCATCGAALRKEYVPFLREMKEGGQAVDDDTINAAVRLSSITYDVMEFISDHLEWLPQISQANRQWPFTYHDPCHLSKGQSVGPQIRTVFHKLFKENFIEMEEADSCCGGGGVFQFDHPDISRAIVARKIENVKRAGVAILSTGCPGCRMTIRSHLGAASNIRVLHPIQLIDQALRKTKGS